jgi:uncharacterized protein YndB with AHSA1/START domain
MAATRITAEPGTPFIDIEREFDAPRDFIFRAHTDPELLVQWLGPRKYVMTVERWEPRDGGGYRYTHRDAVNSYGFHGVFHGDPSPDLTVQTFEYDGAPGEVSLETLVLQERDGRTLLRIHSVHLTVEARDAMVEAGMADGVVEGYERLDELAARHAPVAAR